MQRDGAPPSIKERAGLQAVQNEKESAIASQQYELAAELRDREPSCAPRSRDGGGMAGEKKAVVKSEDIAEIVAMWTAFR